LRFSLEKRSVVELFLKYMVNLIREEFRFLTVTRFHS